jgi:hypothetical protein
VAMAACAAVTRAGRYHAAVQPITNSNACSRLGAVVWLQSWGAATRCRAPRCRSTRACIALNVLAVHPTAELHRAQLCLILWQTRGRSAASRPALCGCLYMCALAAASASGRLLQRSVVQCTRSTRVPGLSSALQQRTVAMHAVAYPPYLPSDDNDGPSVAVSYPHGIKSMSKGEHCRQSCATVATKALPTRDCFHATVIHNVRRHHHLRLVAAAGHNLSGGSAAGAIAVRSTCDRHVHL